MKTCVRCCKKILGRRHGLRITVAQPNGKDGAKKPTGVIHRSCLTKHEKGVLTIGHERRYLVGR